MKKLALLALVSVSVQASVIDDLVNTSDSLKQTFALGIQTIGGQAHYAELGGISPDMATDAFITQAQADAYNTALANVADANFNMTAQEYFDEQSATAMDALSEAIGVYTEAAGDLVSAVIVNQMASEATTQEATETLQTFVANNELEITTESIDTYNTALESVQVAAQAAASFMAVANDAELVGSAQAQADALGESFSFAETAFYSQSTVTVSMLSGDISLDVSGYLKSAEDILVAGEESEFYRTSPVGECFFTQDCY
jgi:hypothetical protein